MTQHLFTLPAMSFRFRLTLVLLSVIAVPSFAQTAAEDERDQREFGLPTDEWYRPRMTLNFGYRILSSGINVQFGNLGSVAASRAIVPATQGNVSRSYDNGSVIADAPRFNETDGNGTQTSTPGGRYTYSELQTDGSSLLVLDGVSYTAGRTRAWEYRTDSQIVAGHAAMSIYSATGEGATAAKDEGLNGGVELSLEREMGKVGRLQWSLGAGVALNSMTAKTSGTVSSTLNTYTDYFLLNGPTPTGVKGGPSFTDLVRPDTTVAASGFETTTPLQLTPNALLTTNTSTVGGATVNGNWELTGAYFLLRVGPTLRTQLTERLGISLGAGVAGAFAGSRYSVIETLELPDDLEDVVEDRYSNESKFLTGFYADLNFDWRANERTGIFAGVGMQQIGGYDQTVAGRTAKIDIGSSVGVRGGLSIKF